jgi:hypothetical protein
MFRHLSVGLITALLITIKANAMDQCQPEFTVPSPPENLTNITSDIKKNPVYVFFDASLSMKGFVVKQPPQDSIYIDLLDQLTSAAEDLGSETLYHKFGRKIEPLDERQVQRMMQENGYYCPDTVQKCELDNKQTRLDKVFSAITADKSGTFIVITDLFISSKDLIGTRKSKLTNPLKELLKQGKSIGILGIMNSFNGVIYDIPTNEGGDITYANAKKRPFYVLIIGDAKNINFVKRRLEQDSLMGISKEIYKFSLITSNVISKNLNLSNFINEESLVNVGDHKLEIDDNGLPIYRFKISQQKKIIQLKFKNNDFIVPDSSGVAEYKFDETFWRIDKDCKNDPGGFRKAKISDFSITDPKDEYLNINIFGKDNFKGTGLRWGYRYFVLANIFTAKNGTAAVDVFSDWDLPKAQAQTFTKTEPVEFKTLNLLRVIKTLNFVADEEFKPTLLASIALDFDLEK